MLKNRNITLLTYPFDGDTGYSTLHNDYFNSYLMITIKYIWFYSLSQKSSKYRGISYIW